MQKELFEQMREEAVYLGGMFVALILLFQVAFYRETLLQTLGAAVSFFWLFILPGYVFMLRWRTLGFFERVVMGSLLSAGIFGIMSYYLGIVGVHVRFHGVILPIVIVVMGIVLLIFKGKED